MAIAWMYEKGYIDRDGVFKTVFPPTGRMFATKRKALEHAKVWLPRYDTKVFKLNTKSNQRKDFHYLNFDKGVRYLNKEEEKGEA